MPGTDIAKTVSKIIWDEIDEQETEKAVAVLDIFTKIYCRYKNDYGRFGNLKFRCDECPFQNVDGDCRCKEFKNKYAPDYKDFGSISGL